MLLYLEKFHIARNFFQFKMNPYLLSDNATQNIIPNSKRHSNGFE